MGSRDRLDASDNVIARASIRSLAWLQATSHSSSSASTCTTERVMLTVGNAVGEVILLQCTPVHLNTNQQTTDSSSCPTQDHAQLSVFTVSDAVSGNDPAITSLSWFETSQGSS